jgi:hypothetical protein
MALIDKLTNIADAIRGKTGGTDPLTLDAMAEAIAAIEAGGGGGDLDAFIEGNINKDFASNATKARAYLLQNANIETLSMPYATELSARFCSGCSKLKSISVPKVSRLSGNTFTNCNGLTEIYLPALTYLGNMDFEGCSNLKKADIGGELGTVAAATFRSCKVFDTLILRRTKVVGMANVSAFASSPFASGGTGGTVYVPSALIESYKTATNWSTLHTAGTCNFVAIEGSEYE